MKPKTEDTRLRRILRVAVSLALGVLIGGLFHYLLYRFSLPSKPFIYVTF
jgi:uncharacterized membrane protein YgaE (UPF0421/DUF939 family)